MVGTVPLGRARELHGQVADEGVHGEQHVEVILPGVDPVSGLATHLPGSVLRAGRGRLRHRICWDMCCYLLSVRVFTTGVHYADCTSPLH